MNTMEHYDGPAFFRNQPSPQKTTRPKLREQEPVRQMTNKTPQTKNTNDERQVYATRAFSPKYVPRSIMANEVEKKQIDYPRLIRSMKKTTDDYLLLDTNVVLGTQAIDLTKKDTLVQLAKMKKEEVKTTSEANTRESLSKTSATSTDENSFASTSQSTSNTTSETLSSSSQTSLSSDQKNSLAQSTTTTLESESSKQVVSEAARSLSESKSTSVSTSESFAKSQAPSFENSESESNTAKVEITSEIASTPKQVEASFSTRQVAENENTSTSLVSDQATPKLTGLKAALLHEDQFNNEAQDKEEIHEDKERGYTFPPLTLLPAPVISEDPELDKWVEDQVQTLNETLKAFHVDATVSDWTIGPTVTQFELTLGRGVKVNKITNLNDDLKLALAAKDIRIEAPIPGKSSVGIEIPNKTSRPVMLSEVLRSDKFQEATSPLTVALGVDLFGNPQITDLQKMPHGLIAGATGSGKSVFINSLLVSLLYKASPAEVKLLLIDPKAVEMAPYHDLPHLLAPVISDAQAASAALKWLVNEMEERYQRLAAAGARNLKAYNEKAKLAGEYGLQLPYIVVVIDELADLMMAASGEVQDNIARLTQKARAAGIHLLVATQRPSVDVLTGTIKNNIPTRIAFMVSSQVDSRTILDTAGAERLLGRGDMLYLGNGSGQPVRLQGTYIEDEVDEVTDFVRTQGKPKYAFDPDGLKKKAIETEKQDELLPRVLDYIVNEETISTSKLQRVFSIGYNRAASLIDSLEDKQYISPAHGAKPRKVFLTQEGLNKLRGEI